MKLLKVILSPLIWFKQLPGKMTERLTIKLASKTGADKPNRFKTWKLKQPWWLQLLIELPIYLLMLWLLNIIFSIWGYQVTPW